jgi:hypothetical protein
VSNKPGQGRKTKLGNTITVYIPNNLHTYTKRKKKEKVMTISIILKGRSAKKLREKSAEI